MKLTQQKILFFLFLISFYVAAWIMQSHILLRSDVSALIHETVKLLVGGKYGKDFFEPNPPMIFYLYIPPVLLMKYFSMNAVVALRLYIFLLASLSLLLSYQLLKRIFSPTESTVMALLLLALTVIYLVLPYGDFGQREHLVVLLVMPYLLLVACRLKNKAIPVGLAVLMGVLGFAGFVVKPHFMLTFLFVEFFCCLYQRNYFAWLRVETLIVMSFVLVYVLSILLFYPEYVFLVVPKVSQFYYAGLGAPFGTLLFNSIVVFCCFPFLFFFLFKNKNQQVIFSSVLLVALSSFLVTYFIQGTEWYYHLLPAYSLAVLLLIYLVSLFVLQDRPSKADYVRVAIVILLLVGFLVHAESVSWTAIIFSPGTFFGYFGVLFAILFYLAEPNKKIFKIALITAFVVAVSFAFTYMAQHSTWYAHRFFLTILLLLLLFTLFVSDVRMQKRHAIFSVLLAMFVFSFPVYAGLSMYWAEVLAKDKSAHMISFLRAYAENKSIVFFSSNIQGYPLVDYAKQVTYASRYSFFVWLPKLVIHPDASAVSQKNYYIDTVAEDLNAYKPAYVFIDVKKFKPNLNYIPFEFLPYFSSNYHFQMAWKPYHYLTTLDDAPLFKYRVYERIDT